MHFYTCIVKKINVFHRSSSGKCKEYLLHGKILFFFLESMLKVVLRIHFYVIAITIKRLCFPFMKDK